jgi:hypothetical protein
MNERTDIERLLERWFDDGPSSMPDRVAVVVADRIHHRRQRRTWRLHWRPADMNLPKLAAAALAVALVAVIGYALLPGTSGSGGPVASPTTSLTATPTSSPAPPSDRPRPTAAYIWPATLAGGTYTTRLIWDIPFELRFTLPDGWQSRDVEAFGPTTGIAFNLVGNTYRDPCGRVESDPPTGAAVADLADALATAPGFDVVGPRPASLDGAPASYLELTVRDDAGCAAPGLWVDPPGSYNGAGPKGPPAWWADRPNMRIWILDVDDVRLVFSALWSDAATAADLVELQGVIDSVRFLR